MRSFLFLSIIYLCLCAYNYEDAKRYTYAAGYAYCDNQASKDCGNAYAQLKNYGIEPFTYKTVDSLTSTIHSTIFVDEGRKEVIIAFSGTKGATQLINEILASYGVSYTLHDISGAKVMSYFFSYYKDFHQWLKTTLMGMGKEDYTFVFTGHSLGGALAVHGAVDVLLSNIGDSSKFKIYTYGHPRVGNKKFEEVLRNRVTDAYRLVHNRDMVPHVPWCHESDGKCVDSGWQLFYPFHTLTEILYLKHTDEVKEFKICTEMESNDCSNGFGTYNTDDHSIYVGTEISSEWLK